MKIQMKWMLSVLFLLLIPLGAFSETVTVGNLSVNVSDDGQLTNAVQVLILLTVLSLAPGILIVMTSFTRIILVLAILRQALGMQQTPPNTVLVSLALFLTLFTMMPVIQKIDLLAYHPYESGDVTFQEGIDKAAPVLKEFMLYQTREEDLQLMIELANVEMPKTLEDVSFVSLVPAFMLSELLTAFQIGFIIFLPFLLVDIIVAAILMSMGMLMVPPMMISLPVKLLLFVLIDGWNLITRSLLGSFG